MTEVRLVYPMLAMVFLTFVVLIVLFRSRVRMVREGHAPVSYFRTFQGSLEEPDYAAKPARHFVNLFLGKEEPLVTFDDGVEVVKMLMTAYQSAELGRTVAYPGKSIEKFVPAVAKGTWKP